MASMKTLWIAGFGDVARRAAPQLAGRYALVPLSRRHGVDLDRPESLSGLAAADAILHCAPPPARGTTDPRTAGLLETLEKAGILPARFVYVSTSGVYGDCAGARVDETRPLRPQTDRARRRADAESQLAGWCGRRSVPLVVLRAPGIYAADRLPLERLRAGTPVLRPEDDVYTPTTWRRSSFARSKTARPRESTTPATTASCGPGTGWISSPGAAACRGRRAFRAPRPNAACRRRRCPS
jgi:nucleoside-diphosphate-sugar epimerase